MSKINANYLFVYGYLMRKNRLIKELGVPDMPVEYLGDGYMYAHLYRVAGFPGLVYDNTRKHRTHGEVYLIREQKVFFEEMDEYELALPNYKRHDANYHRRVRPVHIAKGPTLPCWVYEYILPTDHLTRIKTGRFELLI
ncbi:MAG: gamma-glutamylcyclotransferase family protein [Cyclobacteriaceae bacterium]